MNKIDEMVAKVERALPDTYPQNAVQATVTAWVIYTQNPSIIGKFCESFMIEDPDFFEEMAPKFAEVALNLEKEMAS